jgi:hypothetical protein
MESGYIGLEQGSADGSNGSPESVEGGGCS